MSSHPFGLNENPFGAAHDARFIFHYHTRDAMVALMRKRLADGESFITMTGDSGGGKTSVVTEVLDSEEFRARVAFVAHPSLTPAELIEAVCIEFDAPLPGLPSKPQALASLEHHLREFRRQGRNAVLVLDEAHGLKTEVLEEARLLSNMKADGRGLLQILLVGVPELERRLGLPELAQLRQRIAVHCRLAPLTLEETAGYVRHRVTAAGGDGAALFPVEACEELHAYTNGFPRDVNTLAGRSLEHAERDGAAAVSADHVRMAAGDLRPGITTVQRTPPGGQSFELRRKVPITRAPVEAPRAAEPPAAPVPAPAPEVRKPPSFLRAQQMARAGPGAGAPAAAPAGAATLAEPRLEERSRRGEVTPDQLAAQRAGVAPSRLGDPPAPFLASDHVQELGASVLLAGLMVILLIVSGRWNPVPPAPAVPTAKVETAGAQDPIAPLPVLPGTETADAALDPVTTVPAAGPIPIDPPAVAPQPTRAPPIGGTHAYGFEVASSNYPDSAAAVLKRITKGSKVPVRIIAKTTGDTYRVVVGPFGSRLEAQRAINELFRTTLVKRAQLVQIPE